MIIRIRNKYLRHTALIASLFFIVPTILFFLLIIALVEGISRFAELAKANSLEVGGVVKSTWKGRPDVRL